MEVFDGRDEWLTAYEQQWLAHFRATGEKDWTIYPHPRNATPVAGPGVNLAASRLVLISTAGGYLPDTQQPFDTAHPLGDYSLRLFPSSTPFQNLAFAHANYDHAAVDADPQVLVPLRHLEQMVAEGQIGSLAAHVISFCGYQPDAIRVVDELTPQIVNAAHKEQAQAALLVPA